jgi:transposase-like protein
VIAEALMSAEADSVCGAGYGVRSEERVNTRNGYRRREWDARTGSIELALLRGGLSRDLTLSRVDVRLKPRQDALAAEP